MDLVPEKKTNPNIKKVIGVMSGKGGVGKSTVGVLLAQSLAASGRSVGALDADLTGPSLPRLLGVDSLKGESDGEKLYPIENEEGIKVISINLFNEEEDAPVIWRGPLLAKAVEQFWGDTERVSSITSSGLRIDDRQEIGAHGDDAQGAGPRHGREHAEPGLPRLRRGDQPLRRRRRGRTPT